VIGRGLAAIRFRSVDSGFGYHQLALRKADLRRVAQGSTFEAVGSADLKSLAFLVPPKPQQRRIAQVLDTLDDQIERTVRIHQKLQAMFRGMLVDLMMHGAGRTARNPFGGDTDLRLARLPEGWTMEPIAELLGSADPAMRSGPFGSALLKHELVDSGVPLLGIDNIHVDRFSAEFERFVTPAKALELERYLVRPNDVMITIMGTVGRSCLVPEDIGEALSSKHVWTLTLDVFRYRPYLASLQLNHAPWARAHLRKDEQGGIMSAIRSETLRTLMLPVPPIEEQLEIEGVLRSLESKIGAEARSLHKLRLLKSGLAEALLTGRVRMQRELAS
jgi:type I restriction enzyme S subunit